MVRWPVRDSICIDCRTALPSGTPCPGGTHRVIKLRTPDGRDALLTEVWGPKSLRRRIRDAASVGAVGGTGASLLDGCSGCDAMDLGDGLGGHFWLVLGVVTIAIGMLWFAGKLIADRLRIRRQRLRANGAKRRVPLGPATGRYGKVVAGETGLAPLGDTACVAYNLELRARRMVMLRDAMTLGFEIELDTHERVRIPAGPCVIDLTRAPQRGNTGTYLEILDPLRGETDDLEPFPFENAFERTIRVGDEVEILGRLVPTPEGHGEVGYRDVPHAILVPDGVPRLRVRAAS
jgi:hypothetical protein